MCIALLKRKLPACGLNANSISCWLYNYKPANTDVFLVVASLHLKIAMTRKASVSAGYMYIIQHQYFVPGWPLESGCVMLWISGWKTTFWSWRSSRNVSQNFKGEQTSNAGAAHKVFPHWSQKTNETQHCLSLTSSTHNPDSIITM